MAKGDMGTRQAKSGLRQIVTAIIVVGVILGMWRWLGKGAAPWDPEWFSNAHDTLSGGMTWAGDWVTGVLDKHGSSDQ